MDGGTSRHYESTIFFTKFDRNRIRNGLNSVVRIQAHSAKVCKSLKRLMPREGFESSRPYGKRILSPKSRTTPSLTNHNKPIFTGRCSRQSQLHSGRFKMESRHF